jgi:hypothetical protein
MSFPDALSGNPIVISNGCPIEAFGHDRIGCRIDRIYIVISYIILKFID